MSHKSAYLGLESVTQRTRGTLVSEVFFINGGEPSCGNFIFHKNSKGFHKIFHPTHKKAIHIQRVQTIFAQAATGGARFKMIEIDSKLMAQAEEDLGVKHFFVRGQQATVRKCWHFSTDGNAIDAMFQDDDDFKNGMNRIYVVSRNYKIIILAFVLMDTHVHFVLYGDFDECNRFVHEYLRRTSMYIADKYLEFKKLLRLPVSHQPVTDDLYLKTVICYVVKNPPVAGINYCFWNYPWSSGCLYFSHDSEWTSSASSTEAYCKDILMHVCEERRFLKSDARPQEKVRVVGDLIHPGEYVATKLVEKIFKSCRAYTYFLCKSKEEDVEVREGIISRLSIPMKEMRQIKADICRDLFGTNSSRTLDKKKRIRLARIIKARYDCSTKLVARLCGLVYEEVKEILH